MRLGAFDLAGLCAVLAFAAVLVIDLGGLARPRQEVALHVDADELAEGFREGVQWHALYRDGDRVGFARLERRRVGDAFRLVSFTRVDAEVLGAQRTLEAEVVSDLGPAFELRTFGVRVDADLLHMTAAGRVEAGRVVVDVQGLPTKAADAPLVIPLREPPVFDFSLAPMLMQHDLAPGDRFRFTHFDPTTLQPSDGVIEYLGRDRITLLGEEVDAHHLRQEIGGQVLQSWVNDVGEVLREQLPMGLVAQRETEAEATYGFVRGGRVEVDAK